MISLEKKIHVLKLFFDMFNISFTIYGFRTLKIKRK